MDTIPSTVALPPAGMGTEREFWATNDTEEDAQAPLPGRTIRAAPPVSETTMIAPGFRFRSVICTVLDLPGARNPVVVVSPDNMSDAVAAVPSPPP